MKKDSENSKDETRRSSKHDGRDITPILNEWDYEPGTINVRKISGTDGLPKLQMRLDLGLLQMEISGRPDGVKPNGFESLLEYYEEELDLHLSRNGTELGFHLNTDQCQGLREEAVMYYHRYLGLFVLEDFDGVVRDTARNLRVLDLCGKYAVNEHDRLILEQYRPYIIMMNARAAASIDFKEKQYQPALAIIQKGLDDLRDFFNRFGQDDAYGQSNEVRVLKRFAREIRRKLPQNPIAKLQQQLDKAIKMERYEDAAKLRDEIDRRTAGIPGAETPIADHEERAEGRA